MSASSGKLEPLKLFKVFRSILERRLGGTLTVRRGPVAKQARLAFGHVIAAASNRPEESLAHALVLEGLISSTERVEIDQARRADRRSFEAHVRERGLVAEGRLEGIERRLAQARLLECFAWPDGTFEFIGAQVRPNAHQSPIDTVELLLHGAAAGLPTPVCERFLRGFGAQELRGTDWLETYSAAYDALFAPPNLRGILQSPLAVSSIPSQPGDKPRNLREGAALILAGLATIERAGAPRTMSGAQPQRPTRSAPTPTAQAPSPPPPPAAHQQRVRPPSGAARRQARRSVPPRPASVAPHPTRSEPPSARPPPRPASDPAADRPIRMRASTGPRGRRPERATGAQRPVRRTSAGRSAAPAGEPKPIPPKIQENLDRARALAADIDDRTHYQVLDVQTGADEKAIRLAFRRMARDFHGDRYARYGLDKETLAAVQKVFVAANKAHEVLSSAERRHEYDLSLEMNVGGAKAAASGTGPQLDQVFKAEKLIKDATVLISRGQPEPALERLKVAAQYLPDDPVQRAATLFADHLVAQAQGGSQVILRRARESLEEICAELDNREEPFLYLGRIYRTLDEPEKAIRAFEQALKINPHYAEAGSELRHAQRKVEQSRNSGLAGIFGRRKK